MQNHSTPQRQQQQSSSQQQHQTPRQQMDAQINQECELSDADRLQAITALARGTNGFVLTRERQTGALIFFDALLQCSGDSLFSLTVRHRVKYPSGERLNRRDLSTYKWKLGDLSGFSLEDEATDLITSFCLQNPALQPLVTNSAIGFHFNGISDCEFAVRPPGENGIGKASYSEFSFLLQNPDDLQWWVNGLGHIASVNDLDMDMVDVEEQLNNVTLESTTGGNDFAPTSGNNNNNSQHRRRLSRQQWTTEGLTEEEQQQRIKEQRKTMRRTRFTICPVENVDDVDNTTSTKGPKKRSSVYQPSNCSGNSGSKVNSAEYEQQCAQFREKEYELKTKFEKLELEYSKETSELRLRIERSKNEVKQLRDEMATMSDNHEIELNTQNDEYQSKIDELQASYEEDITGLKSQYSTLMESLTSLSDDNVGLTTELAQLHDDINTKMMQLQEKHMNELTGLLTQFQQYKSTAESEIVNLKHSVNKLFNDKKKLVNALIEAQGNIRVFVRVRPVLPHEIEQTKNAGLITSTTKISNSSSNAELGNDLVCVDVVNQLDMFNTAQNNDNNSNEDPKNKLKSVLSAKDDVQTLLNNSLGAYKVSVCDKNLNTNSEYSFEHVFDRHATQHEIVQQVLPVTMSCLDGYNVACFAYGQTGSGKTFTMEGSEEEMGVNYTALNALFNGLTERQSQLLQTGIDHKFKVELSAVEIYNDDVKDLFTNQMIQVQFIDNKANLKGLATYSVSSCDDIRTQLRTKAYVNRTTALTKMNPVSSRSHSLIFVNVKSTYTVISHPSQTETVSSRLVLIDLAGSERIARSGAEGKNRDEAIHINKSLSILGNCLASLQKGDKHIPFRDSKLTMVLADCLTGDSKVLMFANVSPAGINAGETNSTLQFAQRAQKTGLGKASKNSTIGASGVGGSIAQSSNIGRGNTLGGSNNNGTNTKREDDARIKSLEQEKQTLQQQLHQQQCSFENKYNSLLQTLEFAQQEKQALEARLEKEKNKNNAVKDAQHRAFATPTIRHSLQSRSSCPTPSKISTNQPKLSIIPQTVDEGSCDNENGNNDDNNQLVQLPAPTIVMTSSASSHSNLSSSSPSSDSTSTSVSPNPKKRRSTEMTDEQQQMDQLAVHVKKQSKPTLSSNTIPSTASSSSSRPTISSTRPTISSARPTLTASTSTRPTISAPASKMVASNTTTSRPTISAQSRPLASATNVNRPTISSTVRSGVPTTVSNPVNKKIVSPPSSSAQASTARPTISSATRPTISATAAVPRKTISAAGAVKKPIGK